MKKIKLKPGIVRQFGRVSDAVLARKAGVSVSFILKCRTAAGIPSLRRRRARSSQEFLHLLGTDLDRKIGATVGLSQARVSVIRRQHGIPAFRRHKLFPRFEALLGVVSDEELSAMAGITVEYVRQMRKRKGIARFGSSACPHCGKELPRER